MSDRKLRADDATEAQGAADAGGRAEAIASAPSRTQIKREHQALQALAEQLVSLPRVELEQLGFGAATWTAIDETARIKDRRALRRHYKRIANCLARENTAPLQALLAAREALAQASTARHHRTEYWRERLIAEGDRALAELIDQFPHADRQQLRAVMRAARRDAEQGRAAGPRRLFRELRALLEQ